MDERQRLRRPEITLPIGTLIQPAPMTLGRIALYVGPNLTQLNCPSLHKRVGPCARPRGPDRLRNRALNRGSSSGIVVPTKHLGP